MNENRIVMSPVTKGLYIGLAVILLSVLLMVFMSMEEQNKFSWISYVIVVGGIIWACIRYAQDMNGNVTFGNVFGHGFKTTAVVAILAVLFTLLAVTVIFPEMKDKSMEMARTQMEEQGRMSDTQIDEALTMTDKYFIPFAVGGTLVGYLIIGLISSLIGAAVAKKNPNAGNPMV